MPGSDRPERESYARLREGLAKGGKVKGRLSALRQVDLGGLLKETFAMAPRPIEAFAEANGLEYRSWLRPSAHLLPSDDPARYRPGLLFRKHGGRECNDLVTWSEGEVRVEFANMSASSGDAADAAGWGWVGIRHGLDLPQIVLDAHANDATARSRGGRVVTSLTEHGRGARPAVETVARELSPLQVGGGADERFRALADAARTEESLRLLTGPLRAVADETTASFDVELVDGWVFLYGYALPVSTEDPERWAWVFSLASRWLDALVACGATDLRPEAAPFYTPQRVARPDSVTVVVPDAGFNSLSNEMYWWGV